VVFGGAGFLGSHVADALSRRGHDVLVADHARSKWLRQDQTELGVDILDSDSVAEATAGASAVFNFAGIADIDACRRDPVDTVRVNVLGNAVLLDAALRAGVQRYVFASSVYVYSQAGSFYRVSKQSCELQIEAYAELHGLDYTVLRYGSLYGPRADSRNGIYRLLEQALRGGPVRYAGTGEEIRDYIHVWDAAELSAACLAEEHANKHLIISGNQVIPVGRLLDMITEIFDVTIELLPPVSDEHYVGTPYSYRPQLARKFTANPAIELGQGMIDIATSMEEERQIVAGHGAAAKR